MRYYLSLLLIIFTFQSTLIAQNQDLESIDISLLSVEIGDQLYETFGHTAILVNDRGTLRSQVYNYGTFDVTIDGFYTKFLRGKLPYRLALETYSGFLRENTYLERTVWEQKLDLTNDEKRVILDFLANNLHPDNREYSYDFFFDNCSTRAIDVLKLVGLENNGPVQDITLREMLKTHLEGKPFESFGIDLVIGSIADKKATLEQQYFLPMFLHKYLNQTTKDGKPIVLSDYQVLKHDEKVAKRRKLVPNFPFYLGFFFLIIRLILAGSTKGAKIYDYIILSVGAIVSVVLMFMWFGTDHLSTKNNWNLLWASPLLVPFIFVPKKIRKIISIPLLVCFLIAIANATTQFLPQFFNLGIIPICLLFSWTIIKRSWTILEDIL